MFRLLGLQRRSDLDGLTLCMLILIPTILQAELKRLPAFKLPSDKVNCVSRVAATIMNLLSLAAEKSVPAADDFLPVFVYVIIQANPPSLLSTGT